MLLAMTELFLRMTYDSAADAAYILSLIHI